MLTVCGARYPFSFESRAEAGRCGNPGVTLAILSRWFDWRTALNVVRPEALIRWHRADFALLWRWKSRPGRPADSERVARADPADGA
jgi:hypothetical protein